MPKTTAKSQALSPAQRLKEDQELRERFNRAIQTWEENTRGDREALRHSEQLSDEDFSIRINVRA